MADAIRTISKPYTADCVDVHMVNIPVDAGASKGLFEDTRCLRPTEFAASIVRG